MNEKAIIVEDEGVAARRLQKLLKTENIEVIHHCVSNQAFTTYLESNDEPDLYFLDIHLSDGIIFDVLQAYKLKAPIIFTTAYDQYAIRAFKQNSIDYLLKPIQESEIKRAIEEYRQRTSKPTLDIQALSQLILSNQGNIASYKERIMVSIGNKIKSIPITEVAAVYISNKITYIHSITGRSYPIEYTVEKLHAELDPKFFYQVNRSTIVNINCIENVIAFSNSRLKVKVNPTTKEEIIVARDRVRDFKVWLGKG